MSEISTWRMRSWRQGRLTWRACVTVTFQTPSLFSQLRWFCVILFIFVFHYISLYVCVWTYLFHGILVEVRGPAMWVLGINSGCQATTPCTFWSFPMIFLSLFFGNSPVTFIAPKIILWQTTPKKPKYVIWMHWFLSDLMSELIVVYAFSCAVYFVDLQPAVMASK